MQFHPLANIFPLMDGQAFEDLLTDVARHGVREPIWTYEGQILDGRNRYRAATSMNVPFEMRAYIGDDPAGFVVSLNLHRRHLSESQRAMVAAKLETLSHGGDRKNQDANLHVDAVTRTEAAELLNVGTRSVASAKKILEEAPPEVSRAVESGYMSVNLATQVAALPAEEKAEIAQAPTDQIVEVAREVVRHHRALGTGENEWYTPSQYVEMAREVLGGIDLDPASCAEANETVKATTFYTKDDDGLTKDWSGRVWLNPPYSRDLMPQFVEKLRESYDAGDVEAAILLSHNNTDTAWFHSLAAVATAICFPKRRIKFYRDSEIAAPTNGQAFFYLGPDVVFFADVFGKIGLVVTPLDMVKV